MTRAGERNLDALRRLLGSKAFWSALVALLLAANFARFHQPDQALRTDSRYFVHFAILVADGAVPHRDFFDNKTALASLAGGLLVRAGRLVELNPIDSIRMAPSASWLWRGYLASGPFACSQAGALCGLSSP